MATSTTPVRSRTGGAGYTLAYDTETGQVIDCTCPGFLARRRCHHQAEWAQTWAQAPGAVTCTQCRCPWKRPAITCNCPECERNHGAVVTLAGGRRRRVLLRKAPAPAAPRSAPTTRNPAAHLYEEE